MPKKGTSATLPPVQNKSNPEQLDQFHSPHHQERIYSLPEISKEDDKSPKKYPQSKGGNNSQIELNSYGKLTNGDIIFDSTWRRDAPQGAEALHMKNIMKEIYGSKYKTTQNQHIVQSHFSPYAPWSAKFHIEINGEVKLGYPSNIEDFEGEVIKYLPSFICT